MAGRSVSVVFEVFGRVQGVWFRKYTKRTAQSLQLVGWVMNTRHNTVTGCIQGNEENVTQMKHWLQFEGSPKSKIDNCKFMDEKQVDSLQFHDFEVRRYFEGNLVLNPDFRESLFRKHAKVGQSQKCISAKMPQLAGLMTPEQKASWEEK